MFFPMRKLKLWLIALFLLTGAGLPLRGQCAMCKMTTNLSLREGSDKARAINEGILYLLLVPYVALGLGVWYYFKRLRGREYEENI